MTSILVLPLLLAAHGQAVTNQTMVVTPTVGSPVTVVIQDYQMPKSTAAPQRPGERPGTGSTPQIVVVNFSVSSQNERLRTLLADHKPLKEVTLSMNQVLSTGSKPYRLTTLGQPTVSSTTTSGLTFSVTFGYKNISVRNL